MGKFLRVDKYRFRIKLTCGHEVKAINNPLTDKTKYGCTHGQGCGYSLSWVSWRNVENGQTGTTRAQAREES